MSTEEMKTRIEELNIPSRYYSINGNIASDRYIFRQIYTYWECFYIDERGNQNDYHRFGDENDACEYFFRILIFHCLMQLQVIKWTFAILVKIMKEYI